MKRLEEFDKYKKIYEIRVNDFVNYLFEEPPVYIFTTGYPSENYEPQKWVITKISGKTILYYSKIPSKEKIEETWSLAVGKIKKEDLFIHVERSDSIGKTSRAVKFSDEDIEWSFSYDLILEKSKKLREKYELKKGQFSCKYCGKATDEKDKIRSKIISRMYPGFGKFFDYCSNTCAAHDQFAHEG